MTYKTDTRRGRAELPKSKLTALKAGLAALLLGGAAISAPIITAQIGLPEIPQTELETRSVPQTALDMRMSFAPLVKLTAPAVVSVQSTRRVRDSPMMSFGGGWIMRGVPRERMERSLGSGVIVRSQGVIVTNAHVVQGAQELTIQLSDRREYKAKLIAKDDKLDIAVLQMDTEGQTLPFLNISGDRNLEVGDIVLAIGNPFGVGQTVTSGIISAKGRTTVSDFSSFIQTDAAINPGNSGGALIDMSGELVGVNTAILSKGGGSNGVGLAIPAELVSRAVKSALADGVIARPWLGARTQAVSSEMAQAMGLDRPRGAIIGEVYPGGPADQSGLTKGDVVLSIGGTDVNDDSGIAFKMATLEPDSRSNIRIWSEGKEQTKRLRITLPTETPSRAEVFIDDDSPFAGITAVNMSPKLAEEIGFDPFIRGVVITDIASRSPAARRFRPGDIMLSVNEQTIKTTDDLADIVEGAETRDMWTVEVDRGGRIRQGTIRF
ncbi:Do family serine endopeptidase [Robiginitomaculum antarcticum]|uniref:Do family serine endopeptidase n=1 Tax=Robiginitomaculum antarcticum TaxID=437507 RepID=UPI00037A070B|nr:Do family serine endopeptidase [Robiginitomaculum antarcticum]